MTESADIAAYYDRRHREKGASAWRPPEAYEPLLDALALRPGERFLDVGCGTGHLLAAAARRGAETVGVDLSEEGVRVARGVSPRSTVLVARGESLPFPEASFDCVAAAGSLEHFLDIPRGLAEMSRVLRPGGRLLVVVPNARYFLAAFGRKLGTEQRAVRETLLPLRGWRGLFEEAGLRVLSVGKDWWPARGSRSSSPLGARLRRAAFVVLFALLPTRFTYQFVFLLEKPAP